MKFSRLYYLFLITYFFSIGCANPGTSLSGGEKDETPPQLLLSTPENFTTNFTAEEVIIEFDEFLKLGNAAAKLIISPVMDKKPEVKIRGKELHIKFLSELLPDRTYTLNFGDGIADLNENNSIENFSYVFSTGSEIDSLQISGQVTSAFTNEPAEGVAVMLYQEDNDSLPMTDLPIYLSLTDKEGYYNLQNLASGSYKIFALKDANSNYLFDQPKEEIAFLDSLITPGATLIEDAQPADTIPLTDSLPPLDSLPKQDSLPVNDTINKQPVPERIQRADSLPITDTLNEQPIPEKTDSLSEQPVPERSRRVEYFPKNINLKTFTEAYKKQYITSTSRPTKNQIEVIFNQPLDSLLITTPLITSTQTQTQPKASSLKPQAILYPQTRDSITIFLKDSSLYNRDTLTYYFSYTAFDSVEQPYPQLDTVAFSFRTVPPKPGETVPNPFKISSNFNRTKELGVQAKLFFPEPWKDIDTSMIELVRTRDTLRFKEDFLYKPDTLTPFNIAMLQMPDETDSLSEYPVPERSRRVSILNSFLVDSSYSLTLYPGAFTSYTGLTNDTTKISFKVNNPDQYGTVLISIDSLFQPAILLMVKGKGEVLEEVRLDSSGVVNFSNIKPGKYQFKLILDNNNNGKWDTGRYLKGLQPEAILLYEKELDVKANWELEESWKLEEE